MKRETAEEIVEYVQDAMSNLYSSGYDRSDTDDQFDNSLVDGVLKIAARGEKP